MKKYLKKKSFTLVELIIVIAIIAILAVTAFILLNKWINKSRNSRRISDMRSITNSMQVYYTEKVNYPTPSKSVTISTIGALTGIVSYQGILDDDVKSKGLPLSATPKDPGKSGNYYGYTKILIGPKGFEITGLLESESNIGLESEKVYADPTYAASDDLNNKTPYIITMYNTGDFDKLKMPYMSVFSTDVGFVNSDNFGGSGNIIETVDLSGNKVVTDFSGNSTVGLSTGNMGSAENYVNQPITATTPEEPYVPAPTDSDYECTLGTGDASDTLNVRAYTLGSSDTDSCIILN